MAAGFVATLAVAAVAADDEHVVKLTKDTFDQVENDGAVWLVEFFAPWCGHCKSLAPEWAKAAAELAGHKGKVNIAAVDATQEADLANRFGVRGYPTIKVFLPGSKDAPTDYDGARTASAIVDFALDKAADAGVGVEIAEATTPAAFDECLASKVCVMAILPHIYDTGAAGRNALIDAFKGAAARMRQHQYHYIWIEGGAQTKFESAMSLGSGYPLMLALRKDKNLYVKHAGAFTSQNLVAVLQALRGAKPMPATLPAFATTTPWDGQDYHSE